MDPQQTSQQAAHLMAGFGAFFFLIALFGVALTVFFVYLFWRIFTKAGLPAPLSLLVLIPGIGTLIVFLILAFAEWKVLPAPAQYGNFPYPPQPYPPQPYPTHSVHPAQAYPPAGYPPPSGYPPAAASETPPNLYPASDPPEV